MDEIKLEVTEILNEERQKANRPSEKKHPSENSKKLIASAQIIDTVINEALAEGSDYYISFELFNFLLNSIKRFELDIDDAHYVFLQIQESLTNELSKLDPATHNYKLLSNSIRSVGFRAVRYFTEYLVEQFKEVHITEILFCVKRTLNSIENEDYRFFKEALLDIKKDAEERIELRKEQKRNYDEMWEFPEKEENIGLPTIHFNQDKNLTQDRAILFLDYLFKYAKTSSFKTNKAEVISFLTGYDHEGTRQRLSTIYTDKMKNNSSFNKDLRIVRNLFDKLGLTAIVKQIDDELT